MITKTTRQRQRRGGFSLIEILVVLGVAALVGSMLMAGFTSYQGSQRRSTCSSNLVQIYRACRLYANDFDGYPLFTRKVNGGMTDVQVGGLALLWGTYDGPNAVVRPPVDVSISYLKSPQALHCPADVDYGVTSSFTPTIASGGGFIVDPKYLSYQKEDQQLKQETNTTQITYDDVRTKNVGDPDYARQLRHVDGAGDPVDIPTPSSTVVTWCQFHRGLSGRPDNVLFYDGSVRRMEVTQSPDCLPGRAASKGWLRLAECTTGAVASNEGASLAQP